MGTCEMAYRFATPAEGEVPAIVTAFSSATGLVVELVDPGVDGWRELRVPELRHSAWIKPCEAWLEIYYRSAKPNQLLVSQLDAAVRRCGGEPASDNPTLSSS